MTSGFVDRIARRPSGFWGRLFYRYPFGHKAGFDLALRELPPKVGDRVLEVGCGGGVFLRRLLASGASAEAIDHSPDMLRAAGKLNAQALAEGRLILHQADAASPPVLEAAFDLAYCLNAFFFFPDPAGALTGMARALKPGGRLALVTAGPEMEPQIRRFSPAMAAAMRFDAPEDLLALCRGAGLIPRLSAQKLKGGYLTLAEKPR